MQLRLQEKADRQLEKEKVKQIWCFKIIKKEQI